MRYSPAHAARSGSVPFTLRGTKSARTVLSAAVAGVIGLVPAVMVASPAEAAIAGFTLSQTASATEGQALSFTVNRADATPVGPVSLTWTAAPTGVHPVDTDDFTPASGTLTFVQGDASETITIDTANDSLDEEDETLLVTLTLPGVLPDPDQTDTGIGTIVDNDAAPTYELELDDSTPGEAAGSVNVTARLSTVSGKDVTIPISSADVSAKAGQDYTAIPANETLTVLAGDTESDPFVLAITEDPLYEESEQSFTVTGGSNATVSGTDSATVTITDNEDQPEVTIAPDAANEGSALRFPLTLSRPSERAVTVSASTADGPGSDVNATDAAEHGTAKAGEDYTAVSNATVTFPATTVNIGYPDTSTSQTLTVNTTSDSTDEVDPEDLHVTISNPTVAALGADTVATGGINDGTNDQPTVSLQPATRRVTEGNSGKAAQTFTVKLNKASGQTVKVGYDVIGDSAWDGLDFKGTSGTLTFAPGETSKTFDVDIIGDTVYEGNEDFEIKLSSGSATVPGNLDPVSFQITDDDPKPTVTLGSQVMAEGNGGSVAVFPIKLSNAASTNVEFSVDDIPGSATTSVAPAPLAGVLDYIAPGTTAFVPAGQTTGYVYFLVNGDDVYEPTESMQIELTPTSNNVATAVKTAGLTITNDDAAPSIEVISATANEGEKIQVRAVTVGASQDQSIYSVSYRGASVDGSVAAAADDFTSPGTVLLYVSGGTPSGSVFDVDDPIQITDDATPEGPETILATGTALNGGKVIDGVITIAASDGGVAVPAPTLKSSTSIRLGVGTVTLTGKAGAGATVELWGRTVNATDADYAKIGNSATADESGNFTFTPGLSTDGMWFKVAANDQQSDPVRVYVREDPELAATSTSRGVVRLVVTGDPKVRGLGARVFRQNSNGTFTMVGSGIINANGTFTKVLAGLRSGSSYTYKSYIMGDAERGVLTNWSSYTRTVRVR